MARTNKQNAQVSVAVSPAAIGQAIGAACMRAADAVVSADAAVFAAIKPALALSLAQRQEVVAAIPAASDKKREEQTPAERSYGMRRATVCAMLKRDVIPAEALAATSMTGLRLATKGGRPAPEAKGAPTPAQIDAYLKTLDEAGWLHLQGAVLARALKK